MNGFIRIYMSVYLFLLTISFSNPNTFHYDVVKYTCFPIIFLTLFKMIKQPEIVPKDVTIVFITLFIFSVFGIVLNGIYACDSIPYSMFIALVSGFILSCSGDDKSLKYFLFSIYAAGFFISASIFINGSEILKWDQNANEVGHVIYLSFFCGFVLITTIKNSFIKFTYSLSFIIVIVSTLYLGSRQTFLICMVVILAYLLIYKVASVKWRFIILLLSVIIYFSVDIILMSTTETYLYKRIFENEDDSRKELIIQAIDLFWNKPFFGHGFGQFKNFSHYVYTHSSPSEILFSGGIIGFSIYYSFQVYIIHRYIKLRLMNIGDSLNKYSTIIIINMSIFIIGGFFFIIFNSSLAYIILFLIQKHYSQAINHGINIYNRRTVY